MGQTLGELAAALADALGRRDAALSERDAAVAERDAAVAALAAAKKPANGHAATKRRSPAKTPPRSQKSSKPSPAAVSRSPPRPKPDPPSARRRRGRRRRPLPARGRRRARAVGDEARQLAAPVQATATVVEKRRTLATARSIRGQAGQGRQGKGRRRRRRGRLGPDAAASTPSPPTKTDQKRAAGQADPRAPASLPSTAAQFKRAPPARPTAPLPARYNPGRGRVRPVLRRSSRSPVYAERRRRPPLPSASPGRRGALRAAFVARTDPAYYPRHLPRLPFFLVAWRRVGHALGLVPAPARGRVEHFVSMCGTLMWTLPDLSRSIPANNSRFHT